MTGRVLALCSILIMLALIAGCGASSSSQLSGVTITPTNVAFENNIQSPYFVPSTQTAQFTATGSYTNGKNDKMYNADITDQVVWESSLPTVATINSSGVASPTGCGTTTINAKAGNGGLVATASVTVCTTSGGMIPGGGGQGTITGLTVIPSSQMTGQPGETTQYIAIGTFTGTPPSVDLTDQVTWSSSDVLVATINPAGLATAVGSCSSGGGGGGGGETTITAVSPLSFGAQVSGTGSLMVGSCGTNNLPSLTVYEVGEGAGTVTSTPGPIVCGPGQNQGLCTGNFVLNTPVTLVASPATGSIFGGYSANCTSVVPDPNPCNKQSNVTSCTCQYTVNTNNGTVGAIFNPAQ